MNPASRLPFALFFLIWTCSCTAVKTTTGFIESRADFHPSDLAMRVPGQDAVPRDPGHWSRTDEGSEYERYMRGSASWPMRPARVPNASGIAAQNARRANGPAGPMETAGEWSPGWKSVDKECSACRRSVPLTSSAGQSCPHCGAYWRFERTEYKQD